VKLVHATKLDISFPEIVNHSTKLAHHSVSGLAIKINHHAGIPFFVTIWYPYCQEGTFVFIVLNAFTANHEKAFPFVGSAGIDERSTCFFNNSSM
jgi:hypothetical protein